MSDHPDDTAGGRWLILGAALFLIGHFYWPWMAWNHARTLASLGGTPSFVAAHRGR